MDTVHGFLSFGRSIKLLFLDLPWFWSATVSVECQRGNLHLSQHHYACGVGGGKFREQGEPFVYLKACWCCAARSNRGQESFITDAQSLRRELSCSSAFSSPLQITNYERVAHWLAITSQFKGDKNKGNQRIKRASLCIQMWGTPKSKHQSRVLNLKWRDFEFPFRILRLTIILIDWLCW